MIHQCVHFTFSPTHHHELALICIGRYLKGTMGQGILLSPPDLAFIDCYPDADFAGLYGQEDSQNLHGARSHMDFVILAFGCSVIWKSKLQTEISLSTMEAEYIAPSLACKDLLPLVALIRELSITVGLTSDLVSQIHMKIREDNSGALQLANIELNHMTP
ncbi:hypothetical protein ACHAW6_001847 [Cyclotella cf. meneghiniana]